MAAYREHISVSGLLGAGVAALGVFGLGLTPVQGLMAGWLTAIGGILPDLDSESGRPVREMFGLTASVAPLLLIGRVQQWTGMGSDPESVMVLFLAMYLLIKYGLATFVGNVSVHRGMFHSIPALLITAEANYISYPSRDLRVKLFMAGGIALGFFSHLLLDEMYSVQWSGVRITLKKSAGSALKMFGQTFGGNTVAYAILASLTVMTLADAGIIGPPDAPPVRDPFRMAAPDVEEPVIIGEAVPLPDAPPLLPSDQPLFQPAPPPQPVFAEEPVEYGTLR